jgi:hypothetical protein
MSTRYHTPSPTIPLKIVIRLKSVGSIIEKDEELLVLKSENGVLITITSPQKGILEDIAPQMEQTEAKSFLFQISSPRNSTQKLEQLNRTRIESILAEKQIEHEKLKFDDSLIEDAQDPNETGEQNLKDKDTDVKTSKFTGTQKGVFGAGGILSILALLGLFFMTGSEDDIVEEEESFFVEQNITDIKDITEETVFSGGYAGKNLYDFARSYEITEDEDLYNYYVENIDVPVPITKFFLKRQSVKDSLRPLEEREFLISNRFTSKSEIMCRSLDGGGYYLLTLKEPITREGVAQRRRGCLSQYTQIVPINMTQKASNERIEISAITMFQNTPEGQVIVDPQRIAEGPQDIRGNCSPTLGQISFSYTQESFDLNLVTQSYEEGVREQQRYIFGPNC